MEIIPNVHRIPGLRGVNFNLLLGAGAPTLVDTRMAGHARTILSYVDNLGLAASDLARIVISHYHADHVAVWRSSGSAPAPLYWLTRATHPASLATRNRSRLRVRSCVWSRPCNTDAVGAG